MPFIYCYNHFSAFLGDLIPLITQFKALKYPYYDIDVILCFPNVLSFDANLIMNDFLVARLCVLLFYAVLPHFGGFLIPKYLISDPNIIQH